MRRLVWLLVCLLSGCFVAEKPLYRGVAPLRPFHDGMVIVSREDDGKLQHVVIHERVPGSYVMTDTGNPKPDDTPFRFYPLSGASAQTMIYEVSVPGPCRDGRKTPCGQWLYGLWRLTAGGGEFIQPDCSRLPQVRQLAGATQDKQYKESCGFARRDVLEKALLMADKAGLKPDWTYTLGK